MRIWTNLIIILIMFAGIIALQIFLSKKENKWLGLVLPIISLLFSIFVVLEMYVPQPTPMAEIIFTAILVLLLYNIPTAILLVIYFGCREKKKKNKEIDKMNIQDL